ncbi:putative isomerase YbhE [Byssothecium circinans]|uniref:Putative isomerase YbhE n=1 Tax=Byssothecium circinans TaxID=147558 RepID=A0A6A5TLM7_9PLEO|nr:putative isomerase YbhE [Byssothecium circinans]
MGPQPTWLDLTLYKKGIVVALDEAWATADKAGLYSLKKSANGSFDVNNFASIIGGPVSTQFYNKDTAVAIAHYGGGAVSTYKVSKDGAFTELQKIPYGPEGHGPGAGQTSSHVHHAILDPTKQYLLFPDLGLDSVHVFCIDPTTGKLTAHDDIKAAPGSGPRHGAFWKSGGNTYFFLVQELNNKIVSFKVDYLPNGGLGFTQVDEQSTYGDKNSTFGAAAEIQISPDNKFVLASNRNVTLENIPNPDSSNSTKVPSDSIVTFAPQADGKLKFVQLAPSGGKFPRHFSLNKDGSLVAVGNQLSFSVDIWARDVKTGLLKERVASAFDLPALPNNVLFVDE